MLMTDLSRVPSPPFRRRPVNLKFVRLDRFTSEQQRRFTSMFGKFFDDPAPHPNRAALEESGLPVEESFNMRRFSGGRNLPRGRYYTVCTGADGFSHQTLAMELLAYATIDPDYELEVFDLSDPRARNVVARLDRAAQALCIEHDYKVLAVRRRPAAFDTQDVILGRVDPTMADEYFVVPFELITCKCDRILDLREKPAMEWLLGVLWEYFPGAAFFEGEEGTYAEIKRATGGRGPAVIIVKAQDRIDELISSFGKHPVIRNVALKDVPGHEWPFLALLEYLLNPSIGGTAIDDLIANVLHRFGVECLVYPSSRHDCGVLYDGERVQSWMGFNFVDYRNSSPQHSFEQVYVVENVTYWQALHGALDLPPSDGSYRIGTWVVQGLATQTRRKTKEMIWRARLHTEDVIVLPKPILVERTPWIGYAGGPRPRKPTEFTTWQDLRFALIAGEITLTGRLLEQDRKPSGISIGQYLAGLSARFDLWGTGAGKTAYRPNAWCMVQRSPTHRHRLVCPLCGDIQEEKKYFPQSLLYCHACGFGATELQDLGDDVVLDAVEGALDDAEIHASG